MAKYGSSSFELLLVGGYNLVSALHESVTRSRESATQMTAPFGVGSEAHTPSGMEKGSLTVGGGFYDPTTDALHSANAAVTGISRVVCIGDKGNTAGKPFTGWEGVITTKYELQDVVGDLVKANLTLLVTGNIDEGVIVQPLATRTADFTRTATHVDYVSDPANRVIPITSNTLANPTVVTTTVPHGLITGDVIVITGGTSTPTIAGSRTVTVLTPTTFTVPVNVTVAGTGGTFVRATTQAGGVGYSQVTAYSGFTKYVGTIQDSADDVTYADLVAFADLVTSYVPAAERKTVSGTVRRYLAFNGDVTGSGSVTAFAGFARN